MSDNIAIDIDTDMSQNVTIQMSPSYHANPYRRAMSVVAHSQINRLNLQSSNHPEIPATNNNKQTISFFRSISLPIKQLPFDKTPILDPSSLCNETIEEEPTIPIPSEPPTVDMYRFSRWYRHKLPENITCHYVWFVLHSIITLVLLILYFTNKINISAGSLAIIQLLVGVIVRNEPFIAILHRLVALIPCCRYLVNRMLHCIGGVHISSAISTCIFLSISLLFESHGIIVRMTSVIILLMILSISLMAIPIIRRRNHNIFERFHRYVGWSSILVLIVHVICINLDKYPKFKIEAIFNEAVVITFIVIFIIFLPWAFVRKVRVIYSQPSKDVIIITFPCALHPYGSTTRISRNAREWHAFAIALADPMNDQHSTVIAKAGDWTKKLIEDYQAGKLPPRLWVRNIKGLGFMYSIHAYRRVLIVCTGSGIAPALPYINNPLSTTHTYLLWIGKDHEHTYGEKIWNLLQKTSPNFTLHDTGINGRPNEILVQEYYWKTQVEAVFIVSNEEFTNRIVNALWRQGIPCFGALFDS